MVTLKQELQSKEGELEEFKENSSTLEKELQSKGGELEELKTNSAALEQKLQSKDGELITKSTKLKQKLQSKNGELEKLRTKSAALEQELQSKDTELDELKITSTKLRQELQSKNGELKDHETKSNKEIEMLRKNLKYEVDRQNIAMQFEEDYQGMSMDCERLREENDKFATVRSELLEQIEKISSENRIYVSFVVDQLSKVLSWEDVMSLKDMNRISPSSHERETIESILDKLLCPERMPVLNQGLIQSQETDLTRRENITWIHPQGSEKKAEVLKLERGSKTNKLPKSSKRTRNKRQ